MVGCKGRFESAAGVVGVTGRFKGAATPLAFSPQRENTAPQPNPTALASRIMRASIRPWLMRDQAGSRQNVAFVGAIFEPISCITQAGQAGWNGLKGSSMTGDMQQFCCILAS
jgi:hypothetical protein